MNAITSPTLYTLICECGQSFTYPTDTSCPKCKASPLLTDPHCLAHAGMVFYSGDASPLDHDGYWYDASTWADGYASCVDVCCLPDGPDSGKHVMVSRCTINRLEGERMRGALQCCGLTEGSGAKAYAEASPEVRTAMEIEACKSYLGAEPDESDPTGTHSLIIPDDCRATDKWAGWVKYAKSHRARIVPDEDAVWELLGDMVGRDLYSGRD